MCGMNAQGAQRHDGIFMLQYTSLKMAILLHETTLVNFPMATAVSILKLIIFILQPQLQQKVQWTLSMSVIIHIIIKRHPVCQITWLPLRVMTIAVLLLLTRTHHHMQCIVCHYHVLKVWFYLLNFPESLIILWIMRFWISKFSPLQGCFLEVSTPYLWTFICYKSQKWITNIQRPFLRFD